MDINTQQSEQSLCRIVAPEDLNKGDYVSPALENYQFILRDENVTADVKVIQKQLWSCESGEIFKVINVCLPFVFVRMAECGYRTLDLRQTQVMRLDKAYAKEAFKLIRGKKKKGK